MKPSTGPCGDPERQNKEDLINHIFKQLKLLYGAAFNSDGKSEVILRLKKRQWLDILSHMEELEIKYALDYLKSSENDQFVTFPPNPLEFRILAKKMKIHDLPSADHCFNHAIKKNWELHPIVFHAASECGLYWLSMAKEDEARKRFCKKYEEACIKFANGQILNAPHISISKKKIEEGEVEALAGYDEHSPQWMVHMRAEELKNSTGYQEKIKEAKGFIEKLNLGLTKPMERKHV
jgi:hypothetical protein